MNRIITLTIAAAFATTATAVNVTEGIDLTDFSNDPAAPTLVDFELGSNILTGSVTTSTGDTRDFITFTIPAGQQLDALLLLDYSDGDTGGPGNRGFHAINLGATSFIPGGGTAGNFLGGDHLDPAPVGTDLLPTLAAAPLAGVGFDTPLGPGTYSYVIQQTGPEISQYSLDFVVTPEPASLALLSMAGLAFRRR